MVNPQIDLAQIRAALQRRLPELHERFGVVSMSLFGSYVRSEQRTDSDLDILVSFREAPSLFRLVELENILSDQLGLKVDLVMKDSLKPRIGERILQEAVPV
jgi:hypothetical protein